MIIKQLQVGEYSQLAELSKANELEEPTPEDMARIRVAWGLKDSQGEARGCVALFQREDNWVLDCLAVSEDLRGGNYGRQLVETAEAYLKEQAPAAPLYLVTKVPPFFARLGYQEISRDAAPDFSECFTCSRYQQSCFPQVMVKRDI